MHHVAVYEPDASGHRMVFVRYVAEALARHGSIAMTLITSARARGAPWVEEMERQVGNGLAVHVVDDADPPARRVLPPKLDRQIRSAALLRRAVSELSDRGAVDYVFIPFLDDYCLLPFAWRPRPFGAIPWGGVAIRPRFHLRQMGPRVPRRWEDLIERLAYRRLLRDGSLHRLFTIDPYLAPFLGDPRVETIPDPADIVGKAIDPTWSGLASDAILLLVYGYIDERKGLDRLLEVAASEHFPAELVIALIGEQAPRIRRALDGQAAGRLRRASRLIEVPRRVSEAEERSVFRRADIVWAYYPGSYCSSGAMVRAGQAGRPLLTTREGLVGHITCEHGTGLAVAEGDEQGLLAALCELCGSRERRDALGDAGFRRFAHATGTSFGDLIVSRIADRLGNAQKRGL